MYCSDTGRKDLKPQDVSMTPQHLMLKEKTFITLLIHRDDSLTEYMGVRNDLPGYHGHGKERWSIRES